MRNLKLIFCIVILVVMSYSCSITSKERFKLPADFLFAEQLLKDVVYEGHDSQFGLSHIPLIKNNSNVGIYAFTTSSAHRTYYHIFMFDGNKFYFSNIDQELELMVFLKQNEFSRRKQKLLLERIEKIKKHNEEVYKSQMW